MPTIEVTTFHRKMVIHALADVARTFASIHKRASEMTVEQLKATLDKLKDDGEALEADDGTWVLAAKKSARLATVIAPAGKCPITPGGTDTDSLKSWVNVLRRKGEDEGKYYTDDALRTWLGTIFQPGSNKHNEALANFPATTDNAAPAKQDANTPVTGTKSQKAPTVKTEKNTTVKTPAPKVKTTTTNTANRTSEARAANQYEGIPMTPLIRHAAAAGMAKAAIVDMLENHLNLKPSSATVSTQYHWGHSGKPVGDLNDPQKAAFAKLMAKFNKVGAKAPAKVAKSDKPAKTEKPDTSKSKKGEPVKREPTKREPVKVSKKTTKGK